MLYVISVLFCYVMSCYGILGQVWYLIVSIPDLCTLSYFNARLLIDALWSPARKKLTSWLSFGMSNCEVVVKT